LKQVKGSAGSANGLAFFGSQPRELKSVTVTGAVPYNPLYSNWSSGDRNRKLQVDGTANGPSSHKYSRDSSLIDVQGAPSHLTGLHSEDPRSQFGFKLVSLITTAVYGVVGLMALIHQELFSYSKVHTVDFVRLFGNRNKKADV
jgi:hypothetical protein